MTHPVGTVTIDDTVYDVHTVTEWAVGHIIPAVLVPQEPDELTPPEDM